MPHHEDNNFSAAAEVVDFSALLFDMDGTIIESTPAIVKYWRETGKEIGVDGDGKLIWQLYMNFTLEERADQILNSYLADLTRPPQHRCPKNPVP